MIDLQKSSWLVSVWYGIVYKPTVLDCTLETTIKRGDPNTGKDPVSPPAALKASVGSGGQSSSRVNSQAVMYSSGALYCRGPLFLDDDLVCQILTQTSVLAPMPFKFRIWEWISHWSTECV